MNRLYYGDNLSWLQKHDEFPNESVDLIYLDPPFNSNPDYNLIFNQKSGEKSQAQWKAFDDTWKWEKESAHQALLELTTLAPSVSEFIRWLSRHGDTKSTSMAAYLSMMAIRLLELHRVLKSTGSIYLHCDATAGHYLKVIMDVIFGAKNFRNEIIWQKIRVTKAQTRGFGNVNDLILFYTKSDKFVFHPQFRELDPKYIESHYKKDQKTGKLYTDVSMLQRGSGAPRRFGDVLLTPPEGRHWIWSQERIDQAMKDGLIIFTSKGRPRKVQYIDDIEGDVVDNIWTDISPINSQSKERLPYPTQKPLALLERIINSSSNKDDIILDPFCGCGTAIVAANKLNRKWIGIDVTYLAINLVERRLIDNFDNEVQGTYRVHGDPLDFTSAQELFVRDSKDKHAFELWALKLVNARPRLKDGGVDGVIGFIDENDDPKRIIVQVKGGASLIPSIIRDLDGTVKNENAVMGLLITLHQPTKGMYKYANHAGDYKTAQREKPFPLLQIRTVSELLEGKLFDLPTSKKPEKILYTERERREFLF